MTSQEAGTLGRQGSLPSFPYDPFGVEAYPGTLSSQTIARVVESYAGTTSHPSSPRIDSGSYSPQSINQPGDVFSGFGGNHVVGRNGRSNGTTYSKESVLNGVDVDGSRDLVLQQSIEQHEHMLQLQRLKLRQQQIQDYQEQQQMQHLSELQHLQEQQLRETRRSPGFGEMKRSSVQVQDVEGLPVPSVPRSKDTALVGLMAKIVPVAISSWLSRALLTASLMKKVRPEGVALAPGVYPQRPGEKECAFYMRTGTCAFGTSCKFDHPAWLPAGGIPNWKEGSGLEGSSPFPERPGEPDCAYYIKTGDCKFGGRCKFHHPKDRPASHNEPSGTPTGGIFPPISPTSWGPGGSPFDPRLDDAALSQAAVAALAAAVNGSSNGNSPTSDGYVKGAYGRPAPLNSKGLPIRADEPDCSFYGKTGSCKFGALCKFNHPEGVVPTSPLVASQQTSLFNQGLGFGPNGGNLDYQLLAAASGLSSPLPGSPLALHLYPERPGQTECTFYMKTGTCKYGTSCKFNHPRNRFSSCGGSSGMSSPVSHHACVTPGKSPPPVKLTLAGLPRREDEPLCGYYMKTGACKFGSTCKFDHPPPGEAAAKAAAAALQKEGGGSMSDSDLAEVLTEAMVDRANAV